MLSRLTEADLTEADLSGNTFHDAGDVGGASVSLSDNTWTGNTLDVVQQACGDITPLTDDELASASTWERCLEGNRLVDLSVDFPSLYIAEVETGER